MSVDTTLAPIYAVCDTRQGDGSLRILAEFVDPKAADYHALMLRWSGSAARVVLITEVRAHADMLQAAG